MKKVFKDMAAKRLAIIAILLIAVISFYGCKSESDMEVSDAEESQQTESVETPEPANTTPKNTSGFNDINVKFAKSKNVNGDVIGEYAFYNAASSDKVTNEFLQDWYYTTCFMYKFCDYSILQYSDKTEYGVYGNKNFIITNVKLVNNNVDNSFTFVETENSKTYYGTNGQLKFQ